MESVNWNLKHRLINRLCGSAVWATLGSIVVCEPKLKSLVHLLINLERSFSHELRLYNYD